MLQRCLDTWRRWCGNDSPIGTVGGAMLLVISIVTMTLIIMPPVLVLLAWILAPIGDAFAWWFTLWLGHG
jgi:hypothetical protein